MNIIGVIVGQIIRFFKWLLVPMGGSDICMGDSLWIGVDGIDGSSVTSLNVFRKRGDSFDLVKTVSGEEAKRLYALLTEVGEENEPYVCM